MRRLQRGALAIALGLIVSLLALEAAVRAVVPQSSPFLDFDRSLAFYQVAPERAHPTCPSTESSPLRIAVIGDSFAQGGGVQEDDRYAARLERLLNLKAGQRPAEVRVYAKPGSSTYQEVAFLEEALPWHPDIVILGIVLNDSEYWGHHKRLFAWRDEMTAKPPPPWLAPLLDHSRLAGWVFVRIATYRARRGFFRYYHRIWDKSYVGWERFQQALREFHDRCQAANVRLLAMIFPLVSVDFDHYPFGSIHDQIHQALDENAVAWLDLLDAFRKTAAIRLEVVPGVDPHPDEIGHRIAAEALFDFLLTHGYVDPSYRPQYLPGASFVLQHWADGIDYFEHPLRRAPPPAETSSPP